MTPFWSGFVIVLTLLNIVGLLWLLLATAGKPKNNKAVNDTMGHVWDGDIEELNNPLPRWWFFLFLLTFLFGFGYLAYYPGLGSYSGSSGWTSAREVQGELDANQARLESLYSRFRDRPLAELAQDPAAVKVGRNVFANHCAACHGSDARGATGYPNLVDADWLYGGNPTQIETSIMGGRHGLMPPLAMTLPDNGVDEVAHYTLSLSGLEHNALLAQKGQKKFNTICAACHGVDGKGNPALGAPNLSDDVWLHAPGSLAAVREAIYNGRNAVMPAWESILGKDRVRLAAAWIIAQATANDDASQTSTPHRDNAR